MKKIISLFQRNYDGDRLVRNEVTPGAEWVLAGEGVATQKYDGTCCMVRYGKLFKRHEVKLGGTPPANFEPANDLDETTGKQQGWVPVGDGPDDKWHREAFASVEKWLGDHHAESPEWADGTYELVGPKIQGNPENYPVHKLVPHGYAELIAFPRLFDGIREAFKECDIEGVVWHHPDGRMVKIKKKDFGLKRKLT